MEELGMTVAGEQHAPRVEAVEKLLATAREMAQRLASSGDRASTKTRWPMHQDLIHAAQCVMQHGGFAAPRLVSGQSMTP
jgi:hypothetical protein